MNYPLIINNSRLIGKGFDAFATVHRFSSDLHFKTLPSIIDGLWIFVLNNKLLFKLLAGCFCCLQKPPHRRRGASSLIDEGFDAFGIVHRHAGDVRFKTSSIASQFLIPHF